MADDSRFYFRHLVTICVAYHVSGNEEIRRAVYSGCTIIVNGHLCVLSAGHNFQRIIEAIESPEIEIIGLGLGDSFGPNAVDDHTVPLALSEFSPIFFDEAGADFGILLLNHNQADLVIQNGVVPITEKHFSNQPIETLDSFCLIGAPTKFIRAEKDKSEIFNISPHLLPLSEGKFVSYEQEEIKFPQFVGTLSPEVDLDISGTSGGYILGVNSSKPETYWIIAIQGSWIRSSKTILATPLAVIKAHLQKWLGDESEHAA